MENEQFIDVRLNDDKFSGSWSSWTPEFQEYALQKVKQYIGTAQELTKQAIQEQTEQLEQQILELVKQRTSRLLELALIQRAQEIDQKNKQVGEFIQQMKQENKLNEYYIENRYEQEYEIIQNATYKLTLQIRKFASDMFCTATYEFSTSDILGNRTIKRVIKDKLLNFEAEKYLSGRKRHYMEYFREDKPALIDQFSKCLYINGFRLDGYVLESERGNS